MKIGFIGQGWIGRHYADNFQRRGYDVVRHSLEEPYVRNKDLLRTCRYFFIAVPTPTTPRGFDYSIVEKVLGLVPDGCVAVIKSTLLPGTTVKLQKKYPAIIILHSPEFLAEATAVYDTAHPTRTIIGIPQKTVRHKVAAKEVFKLLPKSPVELLISSVESEFIKYAANNLLYARVVFANILYDIAHTLGCDWEIIRTGVGTDPRIGMSHLSPVHKSRPGVHPGRGAGGHCFIKDMAALKELHRKTRKKDPRAFAVIEALERKNNELLLSSKKDLDLLFGVYGRKVPR